MTLTDLLVSEFLIEIGNSEVWVSIGLSLLLGAASWAVGTWVARTVGLIRSSAPAGERLAVGLGCGLMVLAAGFAAIRSAGRSSFTPVAVGFAIAIVIGWIRGRQSSAAKARVQNLRSADGAVAGRAERGRRTMILTGVGAAGFVVAVALLYGSTMAPSPRAGVQPVEFNDEAFYSVLGRDLATTGTENNLSPSGFSDLAGVPVQVWYHWGELWLAGAVISTFGVAPMAARYLVVLPVVLLAAAALAGTIVQRFSRTNSRMAFFLGFAACLFLAPLPVIEGPFFSRWAVGLTFGITVYGLGAVAALLAIYSVTLLRRRAPGWAVAIFIGGIVAFMVPAHIAIALLASVGLTAVWALRIRLRLAARNVRALVPNWERLPISCGVLVVATIAWGLFTGHATGAGGAPIVMPFNESWQKSIAINALGSGVLLAIPAALLVRPTKWAVEHDLYLGTVALVVGGAIVWGARLGDVTMFYLFFAGIAVFAPPIAAIAVRSLWQQLRRSRRPWLATALAGICVVQMQAGAALTEVRLQGFGTQFRLDPIPTIVLDAVRELPVDAKLAYACKPLSESGFAVSELLTIDAHTNRRVVPMCFEAEVLSTLVGAPRDETVMNLGFLYAPQSAIYPAPGADPSSATVVAFLKDHGIDYIFADAKHPNTLVADAVPIVTSGTATLFKLP